MSEDNDYRSMDKIFAFKKGSIDTSYMAGEDLEPLNTPYPYFFRELYRVIKECFFPKKNLENKIA
ncbi:hypothetical protein KAI04_03175 [Candidatus Pacearchaeota archaeon]|nr:hypothetical protein [Candidatus Pacearchaeota archaeon]